MFDINEIPDEINEVNKIKKLNATNVNKIWSFITISDF